MVVEPANRVTHYVVQQDRLCRVLGAGDIDLQMARPVVDAGFVLQSIAFGIRDAGNFEK